jgi:hypothetical protein
MICATEHELRRAGIEQQPDVVPADAGSYNHRRRHAGIGHQTPITRLNNLLGTYI